MSTTIHALAAFGPKQPLQPFEHTPGSPATVDTMLQFSARHSTAPSKK
jgi:hypothetical protein